MFSRVVKRAITRLRYNNIRDKESPAAQAALGRMMVYQDKAPLAKANPIAAVAWHRESGENPGLWNRTQRKKRPDHDICTHDEEYPFQCPDHEDLVT